MIPKVYKSKPFLLRIYLLLPAERLKITIYVIQRLVPIVIWVMALSLQALAAQFIWRGEKLYWDNIIQQAQTFRFSLIVFALFLLLAGWIIWSRIGLNPDRSGWYSPGTPLLFGQVILAWILGMSFVFWEKPMERLFSNLKYWKTKFTLDFALCMLFWLVAGLVWWAQPMNKWGYFTPTPTPPNLEYYPYSDAAIYDEASQGLLIGISRNASVMLRPLYTFFLALLHILVGQNYNRVVFSQILVLAIIPALIYLIGSKLGNRPAGIMAALLSILREKNSIALTNIIEVSHTKLLLSDVPAMALMLLFVFILIKWLRMPNQPNYRGVLAGAALGLVVLVRSQAQLLVPVILIILLLVDQFQWRMIVQKASLFIVGLMVVIIPWIWRNYLVSGNAAVENPEFYIRIFASGYVHSQTEIDMLAGENFDEYYARMKRQIGKFVIDNPREVARFYAAHYFHNEIDSVLYLPLTFKLDSLYSYVGELMFWKDPSKNLSGGSLIMFLLNLAVISIGIGTALRKLKWIGLIPLFIHLGYSLSVVPLRLSGWRFILPVDWVALLYYSVGLSILSIAIRSIFIRKDAYTDFEKNVEVGEPKLASQKNLEPDFKMISLALIVSILFGLSMPFIEAVTPVRYPELSQDQIVREYFSGQTPLSDGSTLLSSELLSFLKTQNGSVILYGRALYPSYYKMGEYWGDQNPALMIASEYSRLQFKLIGPTLGFVFIPLSQAPESFRHASDVLVIGCSSNYVIRALLIKIGDEEDLLMAYPWHGLQCSGSE